MPPTAAAKTPTATAREMVLNLLVLSCRLAKVSGESTAMRRSSCCGSWSTTSRWRSCWAAKKAAAGVEHQHGGRDDRRGRVPADQAQDDSGDGQQGGADTEFGKHPGPDPALGPAHGAQGSGLGAAFADVADGGGAGQQGGAAEGEEEQGQVGARSGSRRRRPRRPGGPTTAARCRAGIPCRRRPWSSRGRRCWRPRGPSRQQRLPAGPCRGSRWRASPPRAAPPSSCRAPWRGPGRRRSRRRCPRSRGRRRGRSSR